MLEKCLLSFAKYSERMTDWMAKTRMMIEDDGNSHGDKSEADECNYWV